MYLVVRTVGVDEDTSAVVVLCTASFKTTDPNPYVGLVGSAMARAIFSEAPRHGPS
jgi:hypothetical protein